MIRKLTFFSLVLFLASCTITKRVHRPGYHIQWKKIERTQNVKKDQPTFHSGKESKKNDDVSLKLKELRELTIHQNTPEISRTPPVVHTVSSLEDAPESAQSIANSEIDTAPINIHEQADHSANTQSIRPIFWRTPAENLRKLGIALMIIGGAFLLASLLLVLGAFAGNGSGVWLNFFLDLISISEWFWFLFILVIILLIAYIFYLLVLYVFGGPVIGSIVGLSLLGLGIFFYILGERRTYER